MKLPYKLTIGLVLTMAYKGKYGFSPYFFQRVFQKTEEEVEEPETVDEDLQPSLPIGRGKGKGRGKNRRSKASKTLVDRGLDVAKRAMGRDLSPTPSTSSLPSYSDVERTAKSRGQVDRTRWNRKNRTISTGDRAPVWIKKMQLLLNGKPVRISKVLFKFQKLHCIFFR